MIHQHFKLVDVLTVRDNIVLGTRGGSRKQVDAKIRELSQRFALHIDPDRKIYSLSVGEKQMVEIMKVLYRGARTLILDEPTAVPYPAGNRSACLPFCACHEERRLCHHHHHA